MVKTHAMKYLGWIVAAAVVTFALAGDPTCPSDVNDDQDVGTSDLLQVQADWRPCPSPPIAIDIFSTGTVISRLWSNGVIDTRAVFGGRGCDLSDWCKGGWQVIPDDGVLHGQRVTAIMGKAGRELLRIWDTGVVQENRPVGNPTDCDPMTWCGWKVVPD